MELTAGGAEYAEALDGADAALARLAAMDPSVLSAEQQVQALGRMEQLRRALDHSDGRLVDELDRSGGYSVDGHRSAKAAVTHRCRVSGGEALRRVRTVRAWRQLPAVESAYGRGEIPVESMRAIANAVVNPRVAAFLEVADPIFAEQAATETVDDFVAWLRQWERLADADGTAEATDRAHERRDTRLSQNPIDDSWHLHGSFGGLHGAVMHGIFTRFEDAEFQADWDEAKQRPPTTTRRAPPHTRATSRRRTAGHLPLSGVHARRRTGAGAAGQHRHDPAGLRRRTRPPRRHHARRRPQRRRRASLPHRPGRARPRR